MQGPGSSLPPPQAIAVAYTPRVGRDALHAILAFDAHLGRVVATAREPLLAQMRLAWWRDELGKTSAERAGGNAQLVALGTEWAGEEAALAGLVDGWEQLVRAGSLDDGSIAAFAEGRSGALAAFARLADRTDCLEAVGRAGRRWALADLAEKTSDAAEAARARALGASIPAPQRLPRVLRGVSVLDGLAHRALVGKGSLFAGRGASLAAFRLGLLGR